MSKTQPRLTYSHFLFTSYGQKLSDVRKDYQHYLKTGEVVRPEKATNEGV